ncbi:MAG: alanine--tRNA ligase [Patescibacteria group bacterium]|nr:MAG: alanine--tRNA ligase [Patescibacteria group bacterium]
MTSQEILEKYINFFIERGHKQIPNVSLVPEGDSTLLFVNSGMFPLVPYLSGEPHPLGKRLVNVQRSLRFEDLEEVGETIRHTVAFHMLGNWSLGDYFKEEQLPWIFEFFIDVLKLDPNKLFSTVFAGDEYAPRDQESIDILKMVYKKYGIDAQEGERIFPCGKKDNWWQRGDAVGELGGPDSEVYYYLGEGDGIGRSPAENPDEFLEIGNSVFMQYKKTEDGWVPLSQKNVDFGGGLERIAMVAQRRKDIFETDNFLPIVKKVEELSKRGYDSDFRTRKAMRVLSDHMRASCLLIMDSVAPGNKDQGYVLRRLIRRMVRVGKTLGIEKNLSVSLVDAVVEALGWLYPRLQEDSGRIKSVFDEEEDKFRKTLNRGSAYVEKVLSRLSEADMKKKSPADWAKISFDLFQSVGYPQETFLIDLEDRKIPLDVKEFQNEFQRIFDSHQEKSRSGAEVKFKGGLADHSDIVVRYHTATHLLQAALREVLGEHVGQLGSNITSERLRFDFSHHGRKMTDEEVVKVQEIVNSRIRSSLPVNFVVMSKNEAQNAGALYMKHESYPSEVKVYYIGKDLPSAVSKEMCGGPHVSNTNELGKFEIYKQESIGEGKLRLYARLI